MVEVYEASQYRPLAVCYIPSYLDFDPNQRGEEQMHTGNRFSLENLFFIRFPGCDLPHYFFWTRVGEWEDPTIPNPSWDTIKMQQEQVSENEHVQQSTRRPAQKQPSKTWGPPNKRWIRVKKSDAMHDGSTSSEPTPFANTLTNIEHELYSGGFAATLCKYRTAWFASGKQHAWKIFARALPSLYPSGQMPDVPPVHIQAGTEVATKLAMIDTLEEGEATPYSPLTGDEAWTRDDNKFWDIVEVDEEATEETEQEEDALYRRFSAAISTSHGEWAVWLDQVSPSSIPQAPTSLPETPIAEDVSSKNRQEWEDKYLQPNSHDTSPTCPFCCMGWVTMSSEVCFEDNGTRRKWRLITT